jgi:hypothetical protein
MNKLLSKLKHKSNLNYITGYSTLDSSIEDEGRRNIEINHKYNYIISKFDNLHVTYGNRFIDYIPCIVYHISMDLPSDIQSVYHGKSNYNNIYNIMVINDNLTHEIKHIIELILKSPYIGSSNILQIYTYLTRYII